jgi:DNA-binding transcriptional ArsR family regulator
MSQSEHCDCIAYLKALSDESRWEIMRVLASSTVPLHLGDLARELSLSSYNASRHVRILNEAGLIRVERDGRFKCISIDPKWVDRWRNEKTPATVDLGCCQFDFSRGISSQFRSIAAG